MTTPIDLPFDEEPGPAPDATAGGAHPDDAPSATAVPARGPERRDTRPAAGDPERPAVTAPRAEARAVYSVGDLTVLIRDRLESSFFEVWVEGEVSNYRLWNGLAYFTLKDARAQLRVIMFRTAVRRLRLALADGAHVLARGRVTVYEQRGEYQLVCEHVEPRGLGALQLAFEQLKQRLAREGLFDAARKRPLPLLPRKIGIVTSLGGAALRDIVQVITARHANVHLVIRPARVQGEGAADDLARGLRDLARVPGVEVIIAGRGGGSIEDLWAFNEERFARALAASPIPVISAVGHDVDWTIADFVADVRAATPSNAAEIVIARADEFRGRIDRLGERVRAALQRGLDARRSRVERLTSRRGLPSVQLRVASRARHVSELRGMLDRTARDDVAARQRALRRLRQRLEASDPRRRLGALRARWMVAGQALRAGAVRRVERWRGRAGALAARLDGLSPLAVLGRGYALCWADEGRTLVREARPDLVGARVSVTLARGTLVCGVQEALPAPARDDPAGRTGVADEGP
jgi:exodeoxyribonuclease VII large subunit